MRIRFWLGLAAVTAIAVGSVVMALVVYSGDRADFHRLQREEAGRAARQAESVASLSIGELTSAAAFYRAEDDLSSHEFEAIAKSLLRQGALTATAFIRRVPAAGRAGFERARGFPIVEKAPDGSLRRAADRPFYFPVAYAAYRIDASRVLGYDLGSDPTRLPYLRRAGDSGGAVGTPIIPLVLGGSGINVYRPIYRDGAPTGTVAQRRRALIGFAGGSFRVGDLAAAALEALPDEDEAQLRVDGEVAIGPAELEDPAAARIHIADRTWVLVVHDPDGPGLGLPFLLAGVGIALAALLASFIFVWSRNERMEELERQASQDALTGLNNRRRFEEDLRAAMARRRRDGSTGALLMLDLDDFKHVNDTQGHPAGDRLIEEIAAVLRRRTRESDALARLGGDEFAVILPRCTRSEALVAAEAIREAIREHQPKAGSPSISASIGIAVFGEDPRTSPATVVSEADTAMYAAKDGGRDGVRVFDPLSVREKAGGI